MLAVAPFLNRLADTLFPASCAVCRTETGTPQALCADCWREVAFLDPGGCTHCGRPLPGPEPDLLDQGVEPCEECRAHPPVWDRGTAVFRYQGTGRQLVLNLKHGDRQDLLPMLAGWAARKGAFLLDRADIIAPVPLHWQRRLKRRTNQAADLARHLSRRIAHSAPQFAPRLLVRTRSTGSQGGKDRDQRIANVAGAFALGPNADIAGKSVLLIDDVMTTGATLNGAAQTCLLAGAARVDILVLALVTRDDDAYIGSRATKSPASEKDKETNGQD